MLNTKLERRFGGKTKHLLHITCIKRQPQDDKQGLEETVDEFANKVLNMTTDGYPDTPEDCPQTVVIDALLQQTSCSKFKEPNYTLYIATQCMKTAVTKTNIWSKKSGTRIVKFEKSESKRII